MKSIQSPRVFCAAHIIAALLISIASVTGYAQQPAAPVTQAPLSTHEVVFRNGDTKLAGTVLVPANMVAAVVVVHGSGQEPRDMAFAQALAQRGIAALTYDKRGVGKSGGVYAGPEVGTNNVDTANLDLLAEDAVAAARELTRRIASPRTSVGLIGASQAGWIVPLAAARSPEVKFIVIWSGPLVTTLEQLRFQFFTDGKADFWERNNDAQVREHIRTAPDRYQFAPTDPVASLQKLSIPGLWLYGKKDLNVPVTLSIERLSALKAGGKRFDHTEFADAGHQLPFNAALDASAEWIVRLAARGTPPKK